MVTEEAVNVRPVIDATLVRRLVETQFPQWAAAPLRLVDPAGSDHVIYRLGDELSVRIPRHAGAIHQAQTEFHWLPQIAPHLPLAIPVVVGVGEPDFGYPWPWAIARWLAGEVATVDALGDSTEAAVGLAAFLGALQRIPTEGAGNGLTIRSLPSQSGPSQSSPSRSLASQSLTARDRSTRAGIAAVAGVFDAERMSALWDAALDAPGWDRAPVWFHGDFHTGNLLMVDGRLSAVIDFGGLGIGDPACDLTIAYTLMTRRSRDAFREALGVDDTTWLRGRGWALTTGLSAYTAYASTHPGVAAQAGRQIRSSLNE